MSDNRYHTDYRSQTKEQDSASQRGSRRDRSRRNGVNNDSGRDSSKRVMDRAKDAYRSLGRIDNIVARFFYYGLLIAVAACFVRNIRPYDYAFAQVLEIQPNIWTRIAAIALFGAIQYFEVWGWTLRRELTLDQRVVMSGVSVVAHVVDSVACLFFLAAF